MIQDIDIRFQEAVQAFWSARQRQQRTQVEGGRIEAGTRGAVTGGTQMGALEVLMTDVLLAAGLNRLAVRTRTGVQLPGYFRPEKKWDLLVVAEGRLVLAIEFKSHVGPSFGNNANNRAEEAIGNAEDIWTAYREGRLGSWPAPLLGYFILLEDCPKVHAPIANAEPFFEVDPVFKRASYIRRYELLCERLLLERKYNAACLTLATNSDPTVVSFPNPALAFSRFVASVEAHAHLFVSSAS